MTERTDQQAAAVRRSAPSRGAIVGLTALVAATAAMAQIQLHEYAHAVVALLLTGSATVTGAMADHPPTTDANLALIAIAGPVFSLVLGASLYALGRARASGYGRALLVWAGLASLQGAFGYVMISLVAPVGDTAVAFESWGVPMWGSVLAFVVGLAGMFLNAYLLCREITRALSVPADIVAASVWTWLVATGVLLVTYAAVALAAGADGEILVWTVIGPGTALVFAPMATFFWRRTPHLERGYDVGRPGSVVAGFVVVLVIVLVHGFVGVELGG